MNKEAVAFFCTLGGFVLLMLVGPVIIGWLEDHDWMD